MTETGRKTMMMVEKLLSFAFKQEEKQTNHGRCCGKAHDH
jgi:hypothetical protein